MTLQVERSGLVAYVRKKTRKDGTIRWYARYLGTDGRYHEEGGHPSKLAAARRARNESVRHWAAGPDGSTDDEADRWCPSPAG